MNEMVETNNMLRSCDSDSFLIMDELGRGTSVYEGLGLAKAIALHINQDKKSFCLFATHFYELTLLEEEYKTITNMKMEVVQ